MDPNLISYNHSLASHTSHHLFFTGFCAWIVARLIALASFVVRFPISHPQPLSTRTTFGVMEMVSETRMKMKDLWIA